MILDATCSAKRIWPEHADVRMDISPEARPDVRGDAERLPFRDGAFDEVFCDPPHFIGFPGDKAWDAQFAGEDARARYARFSKWADRAAWDRFLSDSSAEFFRVLKPGGVLRYKVPDGSRSHGRVADYRDVVDAALRAGFGMEESRLVKSEGLMSRGNEAVGKASAIVFYLNLRRPGDAAVVGRVPFRVPALEAFAEP